jgi:hypothetical protein
MNKIATKIISVALTGMLMLSALAVTAMPSPVTAMPSPVSAGTPVLPTSFYGNLTVNGASAPVNTTVTGTIVSAVGSPGEGNITTTETGKYGGPEWYDTKLVIQTDNSSDIDKTIEFYVQLPSWAESRKANENATLDSDTHNLDLTVNATCNLTINVTPSGGGNVTVNGTMPPSYPNTTTWNYCDNITLNATAASGYSFVNWSGNLTGSTNPINITMSGNYSITANFVTAVTTYNLTINSTAGGNVTTPGEGTFTYNASQVVALVAAADTNYSFVNWTGDVGTIADVNSTTTNITMNGNYSITANFAAVAPTQYNLTINSTAGGSVTTPGEGTFTRNASQVVSLVAAADTNYSFVNWTGDVSTIDNVNSATTNITMSGNYSITANFAAAAINATLEGHVNFSGRGTPPNSTWAEPFNVTLFEAGNLSHVLWTGNATTNNTGVFTISGLTAGTYDIGIKNWTCLSELNTSVTLTAGNTTVVDFGTTREGDANNDDYVNILDASSLVPCYGSSTGGPSWNEHCDFNRDGHINILDASALASNYGEHGDLV